MQRIVKRINLILACSLLLVSLTGCGGREIVLTKGFEKGELMRINTVSCFLPEMMLYLTTVQNEYEEIFGPTLWEQSYYGVSMEEKVKDMVLAKAAQIKVMNLMAETYGVSLDDNEKTTVSANAQAFFDSLSDREKELIGVTYEDIEYYYSEYALADKVYEYVIRNINPEISDDEARTVTVHQILIKTYSLDGNGNRVEYSDRAKKEAKELADSIYDMAVSGDYSFESLAEKYNEGDETTYSFMQGQMAESFEKTAFSLDTDEISEPVETESGYHIIKCVSNFDVEETQANKVIILEERKAEVFDSTYDEYLSTLTKTLNEKLYAQVKLIHDPDVDTSDFFKYMEKVE